MFSPKRLIQAFILIIGWLGFAYWAKAASPVIINQIHEYSLSGHIEILLDSSGELTFDKMLSLAQQRDEFEAIPGFLNKGYTTDTVWVRFTVVRQAPFPEEIYLLLDPPTLDYLSVYVQRGDDGNDPASYVQYQLGDQLPVSPSRLLHPGFVVPVNLSRDRPTRIYARLQTTSVLSLAGVIMPLEHLRRQAVVSLSWQAGWLAICLFIGFMGLLCQIVLRDSLYGYFGMYILALSLSRFSTSGLMSLVWPERAIAWVNPSVSLGFCLATLFMTLFSIQLYGASCSRKSRRFLRGLMWLTLIATLCLPFVRWSVISLFVTSLAVMLFAHLSGLSLQRNQDGSGRSALYFLSFSIYGCACLFALIRMTGFIQEAWLNVNAFNLGSGIHIILLLGPLFKRLNYFERRALAAERNAKQEAVKLAKEMTRELDEKHYALEKALQRQAQFIAMLSHEYRTPLAIIRTNLDILNILDEQHAGKFSAVVGKMNRAITRLVEVLEISLVKIRMAEDILTMQCEDIPLNQFAGDVIGQAAEFWPQRQFVLLPDNEAGLSVNADRNLLKTALLNLLDNAVKYSAADTIVTVAIAANPGEAIVRVIDQGTGIPVEERNRVFEKYYRCRGTGSIRGTGLGLYLVKRIIEEHQGSVSIDANAGQGTEVTLKLPSTPIRQMPKWLQKNDERNG